MNKNLPSNVEKTQTVSAPQNAAPVQTETKGPQNVPKNVETQKMGNKAKEKQAPAVQTGKEAASKGGEKTGVSETVKKMMEGLNETNYLAGIDLARKYKQEAGRDKCLDMLEAMIKKGLQLFGEFDVRLARPYFRLGDVLLQKLEDQNELFGDNIEKKKKGDSSEPVLSEREEEIKVAWENLEIARVILEKHLERKDLSLEDTRSHNLGLADIFKRIGECENLKENFTKAREELAKGISILEGFENKNESRLLSENYYLLSRTISYEAKPGYAKEAKVYLDKAIEIIEAKSKSETSDEALKKELAMILGMMTKNREDLVEEINATDPADLQEIKKAISKTGNSTMTAFPKSQLKEGGKVNKLGIFGKGSETLSKKLKEPATCGEAKKRPSTSKSVKKVQASEQEAAKQVAS